MSAETFRQTIEKPSDRVIVALDNMNWLQADIVMGEVGPHVGLAKANSIAQQKGWKHAVDTVGLLGAFTMADAKYKDVPSTMENYTKELTACGPRFITIHANNTVEAMESAVKGRDSLKEDFLREPWGHEIGLMGMNRLGGLLGITVLTSIEDECESIYGDSVEKKVMQFAHTAAEAGLDGIVCSGQELEAIRADSELDDMLTIVPGITPKWAKKADDQKRIVTPAEAIQKGADYIVVGRAITKPPEGISREEAAQRIAEEVREALYNVRNV